MDLDNEIKPINKKHLDIIKSPHEYLIPKHPFRCLISGPSNSGKTVLFVSLLTNPVFGYKDFFHKVILIGPNVHSEQYEPIEDALGDKLMKMDEFDNKYLLELLDYLKEQKEELGALSPRVLVVFDDCLDNKEIVNSSFLKALFIRGRHSQTSSMFLSQAYNQFPLVLRKQLSNVIQFPTPNKREVDCLAEELNHPRLTEEQFKKLFHYVTKEKHNFLHINLQCPDKDEIFRKKFQEILRVK